MRSLIRVGAIFAFGILAGVSAVSTAAADDPPEPSFRSITTDTTLDGPHLGTIHVDAPGVTLDCAGHRVTGPWSGRDPAANYGIIANEPDVVVTNCIVEGFEFGFYANSSDVRFENNTAMGNDIGFVGSDHLSGLAFVGNRAEANVGVGFAIDDHVTDSSFVGNTAIGGEAGFAITTESTARIEGNTAMNNDVAGYLLVGSSGNRVEGNTATNSVRGYLLFNSSSNTIEENKATDSKESAYVLVSGSAANMVKENSAKKSGDDGIFVSDSVDNTFEENHIIRSGRLGISDDTNGSGTAGTANRYDENRCTGPSQAASEPPLLCSK